MKTPIAMGIQQDGRLLAERLQRVVRQAKEILPFRVGGQRFAAAGERVLDKGIILEGGNLETQVPSVCDNRLNREGAPVQRHGRAERELVAYNGVSGSFIIDFTIFHYIAPGAVDIDEHVPSRRVCRDWKSQCPRAAGAGREAILV